jgi:hypothetical protein
MNTCVSIFMCAEAPILVACSFIEWHWYSVENTVGSREFGVYLFFLGSEQGVLEELGSAAFKSF